MITACVANSVPVGLRRQKLKSLRPDQSGSSQCGLTLVELIVSLAISALLLVTVMGMTAHLSQAAGQVRGKHRVESWQEILQERLQSDYSCARSIIVEQNRMVIRGLVQGEDTDDGRASLRVPGTIVYSINTLENRSVLIRVARPTVAGSQGLTTSDFLATGIVGFQTATRLATDVAPGTVNLQIFVAAQQRPITFSLVRHGMPE